MQAVVQLSPFRSNIAPIPEGPIVGWRSRYLEDAEHPPGIGYTNPNRAADARRSSGVQLVAASHASQSKQPGIQIGQR